MLSESVGECDKLNFGCRASPLICEKALRLTLAIPRVFDEAQPRSDKQRPAGKPQAFRTSGGKAAGHIMKTLITNGQIITATDNYKADIFIDGETITTIGAKLEME